MSILVTISKITPIKVINSQLAVSIYLNIETSEAILSGLKDHFIPTSNLDLIA
jgi:hypothetical protein